VEKKSTTSSSDLEIDFGLTPSTTPTPTSTQAPTSTVSQQPVETFAPVLVHQTDNLHITFQTEKKGACDFKISAFFVNQAGSDLTEFDLQIAVPPYLKMDLEAPSSKTIPANRTPVTQIITLNHSEPNNQKKKT